MESKKSAIAVKLAGRIEYTKTEIHEMLSSMEERLADIEWNLETADDSGDGPRSKELRELAQAVRDDKGGTDQFTEQQRDRSTKMRGQPPFEHRAVFSKRQRTAER
jgi:hypothetical protein